MEYAGMFVNTYQESLSQNILNDMYIRFIEVSQWHFRSTDRQHVPLV